MINFLKFFIIAINFREIVVNYYVSCFADLNKCANLVICLIILSVKFKKINGRRTHQNPIIKS